MYYLLRYEGPHGTEGFGHAGMVASMSEPGWNVRHEGRRSAGDGPTGIGLMALPVAGLSRYARNALSWKFLSRTGLQAMVWENAERGRGIVRQRSRDAEHVWAAEWRDVG